MVIGEEVQRIERQSRSLQQKLDFAPIREEWREAMEERFANEEYGRD